jgi:hypothetical protein
VKQISVLRGGERARQCLIEVMMCVDESGQNDHPARVDHAVGSGGQFARRADLYDHVIANEERTIANLAARRVHRYKYVGVFEKES